MAGDGAGRLVVAVQDLRPGVWVLGDGLVDQGLELPGLHGLEAEVGGDRHGIGGTAPVGDHLEDLLGLRGGELALPLQGHDGGEGGRIERRRRLGGDVMLDVRQHPAGVGPRLDGRQGEGVLVALHQQGDGGLGQPDTGGLGEDGPAGGGQCRDGAQRSSSSHAPSGSSGTRSGSWKYR